MALLDNYIGIVICVVFITRGAWLCMHVWRQSRRVHFFQSISIVILLISVIGQVILVIGVKVDNDVYEWIGHLMRVSLAAYITSDLGKGVTHA